MRNQKNYENEYIIYQFFNFLIFSLVRRKKIVYDNQSLYPKHMRGENDAKVFSYS